jgi:hypothetical protein
LHCQWQLSGHAHQLFGFFCETLGIPAVLSSLLQP